jgi:hypothetical protein
LVSGFAVDSVSVTKASYRRIRWRHVLQREKDWSESGHSLFQVDKEQKKEEEKGNWIGRERWMNTWISVWVDKDSEDRKSRRFFGTDGL